jgi:hypothetical protein
LIASRRPGCTGRQAAAQTAVLTTTTTIVVVVGRGAPTRGAVVASHPAFELYITLAVTAAVAALTGLAMSAIAKSQDQILPMLVVSVMLSIVFCGELIPVKTADSSPTNFMGHSGSVGLRRFRGDR